MWIVVLFKDDSTLAAVPAFWFRNGSCAWPNKFSTKYIERRKQPNELEFKQYKVEILFKNIGIFYFIFLDICGITNKINVVLDTY